ncbi:hypothetical protein BV898_15481 [Hypsibius exemplaris]|uniref:Uncharacterized protein n=1 Tax=Hypsibius exemplaris TaxID=2072580 RepID=A0A9X6NBL5_HYPEX|nr:hypothetical protein BV898_15481 [Hypsibius exemplaris]
MAHMEKRLKSSHHRSRQTKPLPDNVAELISDQFSVMWTAHSDKTKDDAVNSLRGQLRMICGDCTISRYLVRELANAMIPRIFAVLLMPAALKNPVKPSKDRLLEQYLQMMHRMAKLLYMMYSADITEAGVTSQLDRFERGAAIRIIYEIARRMGAGKWEIRYRLMQFLTFIIEECDRDDVLLQCLVPDGAEQKDVVKAQILLRAYDSKMDVAALAMKAIGHYQTDEKTTKSKAFSVLFFRMQESDAESVRLAATKVIAVCSTSAPAICRRVLDKSSEVRVAAYGILGEKTAPKIFTPQLRAFLLQAGLNHQSDAVRAAALVCLNKWRVITFSDKEVEQGLNVDSPKLFSFDDLLSSKSTAHHPKLSSRKQLTIEDVFNGQPFPQEESAEIRARSSRRSQSLVSTRGWCSVTFTPLDDSMVP